MVSTFPSSHPVDLSRVRLPIRALQPQLVEWRRRLHQHPELGFQEKLTAEFVSGKLQAWEIEHQIEIAKTGIVATIVGTKLPTPDSPLTKFWQFAPIWMLCRFKNLTKYPIDRSMMA